MRNPCSIAGELSTKEDVSIMAEKATCPHCGKAMDPIEMPDDSSWGGEVHHICFNDECTYFVNSWKAFDEQGIERMGYRCRMDPRGACGPAPVWSANALRDRIVCETDPTACEAPAGEFAPDDFAREDETPDAEFYRTPRFVDHLDSLALSTLEDLYARLIPAGSKILDLMAGPDSHLKPESEPAEVVGLGLNQEELDKNEILTERVIHDLNADPKLPFEDSRFDAVICTVSVDYLTNPVEVFSEAARVLKPNAPFIVVFSNRMFPPKAVEIWKRTNEAERVELVKKFFRLAGSFSVDGYFESKGKPRPQDDKYYSLGIPSDPVYAVWGRSAKL